MPLAKAFEGFLKKLFRQVRLITAAESRDAGFRIGVVFDKKRSKTTEFLSKDKARIGFLENLDATLTFCRHFLMHSQGVSATEVQTSGHRMVFNAA
jgi:hypothetical protein